MLIAVTGFAGAGKSSAVRHLTSIDVGTCFYVGGIVTQCVQDRGLLPTPENERQTRNALRVELGMAALAQCAEPDVRRLLETSRAVLIDAICNAEEAALYRTRFGDTLVILAIETTFAARAERLSKRPYRPLTSAQLLERDSYETNVIRLGQVIDQADLRITNDTDIASFERTLTRLADSHLRD